MLRQAFCERQETFDSKDLVFLDECGSNAAMAPRYGRALKGQRVHEGRPVNYGKNLTILGALTQDGFTAAMTTEGSTTTAVFLAFVQNILAPTLRKGHLVILDNLSAHKSKCVVQAIEKTGARVCFLPPYSPDLNPIESAWAKLKHGLRKRRARTIEALNHEIADLLPTITPKDAQGWFGLCGYGAST